MLDSHDSRPMALKQITNSLHDIDQARQSFAITMAPVHAVAQEHNISVSHMIARYDRRNFYDSYAGALADIHVIASLCVINLGLSAAQTAHVLSRQTSKTMMRTQDFNRRFSHLYDTSPMWPAVAAHLVQDFCQSHARKGLSADMVPVSLWVVVDADDLHAPIDVMSVVSLRDVMAAHGYFNGWSADKTERMNGLKRGSLTVRYQRLAEYLDDSRHEVMRHGIEQYVERRYDELVQSQPKEGTNSW